MDNNYLAHIGVKGRSGRYPLGSGKNPYQRTGGSPRGKSKKSGKGFLSMFKKKQSPQELKKREEEKKKQEEETVEAKKKRILDSGSAKDLYENSDLFTSKELNDAYQRMVLKKNIQNMIPEEVDKGKQFVDRTVKLNEKVSSLLGSTAKAINSGTQLYESVQKVKNLFDDKTDKKTNYRDLDVNKASDKELADAVNRATKESLLKKYRTELSGK